MQPSLRMGRLAREKRTRCSASAKARTQAFHYALSGSTTGPTPSLGAGPEGAKLDGSDDALGIVPRACMQLFQYLPVGHTVSVSYVEVYNDGVNDLLAKGGAGQYLQLRETKGGHVEPENLTRVPVASTADVMASIASGCAHLGLSIRAPLGAHMPRYGLA